MTALDAADFLGVSVRHVYYLIDMSYLEAVKVRKSWRLYHGEVERYAGGGDRARVNGGAAGDYGHRRRVADTWLFPVYGSPAYKGRGAGGQADKVRKQLVANNIIGLIFVIFWTHENTKA
jgi:excisionase family DNA binding protein